MERKRRTIRELREERGWTQLDLAYRLGVGPNTVSNWERGKTVPRVSELRRLAALFGVCSDDIILPGEEEEHGDAEEARSR